MIVCCCKRNKYVDYYDALKVVNHDVDRNLDIITLLRRLRMHGMALSLSNDKATKLFIANQSKDKHISTVTKIEDPI